MLAYLLMVPLGGILVSVSVGAREQFLRWLALAASTINLSISIIIYVLYNFSSNHFQFVQEHYRISSFDIYLGVDGISIYFVLLTTIIMPIAILSNWDSVMGDEDAVRPYVIIMLLLETLLLAVFLVLDALLFYICFESILPPLFVLIGVFGSSNRVRASFYLFLYTLLGSLFLLLSILTMSSIMGTTDFDALYKTNFDFYTQIYLFIGIFIAFAVKTPTIFLNSWLLKAHVESPLGGSIILAGVVLKLSLYGILRLMLPIIPQASIYLTPMVYVIGVVTIIYASFSTLRTIDIKELIAYSSVSHAAVYLMGVFSNSIQGIEGGIVLGLAHGFVSSALFICAGGVLYDRTHTRLIIFYRGMAQAMPIFSILLFVLCLANAGTPLTLNFIGEFMSLYGTFERVPLLGIFASSSIILSAAYTIYMFNRIAFGGSYSDLLQDVVQEDTRYLVETEPELFVDTALQICDDYPGITEEGVEDAIVVSHQYLDDVSKREFALLMVLAGFTVILGIYPAPILDGLHYSVSSLIYYGNVYV